MDVNQSSLPKPITLQTYVLEQMATPHPSVVQAMKKTAQHHMFVRVLAMKVNAFKDSWVQILGSESYDKQGEISQDIRHKIQYSLDILKGIGIMNDLKCSLGEQTIGQVLAYSSRSKSLKLKGYKFVGQSPVALKQDGAIIEVKPLQKNLSNALKFGIERCFSQTCNQTSSKEADLWKWAYFVASQFLYREKQAAFQQIFEKLLSKELPKLQDPPQQQLLQKLPAVKQFQNVYRPDLIQNFMLLFTKCLNPNPKLRPQLKQIIQVLQIMVSSHLPDKTNTSMIQSFKQSEQNKRAKIYSEFQIQIPEDDDLILTAELKKKISPTLLKNCGKGVKQYKALYRATRFNFDAGLFYSQCSSKKNTLFCIQTVDNGTIVAFISPEIELNESNGFQGGFIEDKNQQSFIYSTKTLEFSRLVNKDKAFRTSPLHGPIIGDGDIILGNNPMTNYSYFPKSYEQSRKKMPLISQPKEPVKASSIFKIKNYDVYQVILKK